MKKIWNQLGHSLFAEDESSRKTKHILKTVFFFYILVLLKVIVFKYPLARLEAITASWTKEVVWEGLGTANFTLFKTIRMYIRYWGKLNSFEFLFGKDRVGGTKLLDDTGIQPHPFLQFCRNNHSFALKFRHFRLDITLAIDGQCIC